MAHTAPITCVDHDPVTDRLITGGYDGRVVAWRGGEVQWQVQLDDLVNDVRLSPDGNRVAVAVADRYAMVLDVLDGSFLLTLGPHGDDVNSVRWLAEGNGLVCVMDHLDPAVRVWTGKDGTWEAQRLSGHDRGVFGAALDPDGRRLATAAEDGTARVWDLRTLAVTQVLHHPGDPEAIDWSPDGALIATGCDDGICRLWDPDLGTVVRLLEDATAAVRFVRFSADGTGLLVGAYDATLRDYDTATWRVRAEHRHPRQWERTAVYAGDRVVVGSFGTAPVIHPHSPRNNSPRNNSPRNNSPTAAGPGDTYGINALAVLGDTLVIGRDDGAVLALHPGPATPGPSAAPSLALVGFPVLVTRHPSIVNAVAFSPDGRTVASADYRSVLRLSALDGTHSVVADAAHGGPINTLVWHPDGHSLFSAGYDGVIRQWDPHGQQLTSWAAHHAPVKSLAWSSPTALLVAGSSDATLSAWLPGAAGSSPGRAELAWRAAAPDMVLVNAVTADATGVIVSASRDLLVRRWDATTGALIESLPQAHTKSIKAVATSPDGARLLTGAYDGNALLWQRGPDGWRWRRLVHHGKPGVPAVGLGWGGALTAGWNGSVAQWSPTGELLHALALSAAADPPGAGA